jgi:hypothetical protein
MDDTNVTNKEVAEVKIGRYSVTLDKDKLDSLSGFCERDLAELGYIREMMDMMLDMCMGWMPEESDCLKYMKYLKYIRDDYEFLQKLGVTVDRN